MSAFELRFAAGRGARCAVHVGRGATAALRAAVAASAAPLVVVISDGTVAALHGERIGRALRGRGRRVELLSFPAGERSKTRRTKQRLEDGLAALGAGRDTLVVALGGGVTGDLAGFVAATWHRGVRLIQVPTSLLAMVDAALGGKTAVNVPAGKNLVGAFHQPEAIVADPALLRTLPAAELAEGLAEVVKSAAVADAALFGWLESNADALLARRAAAIAHIVERCLRIKASIVRRDEREAGRRAALNFGHTVGHAIEAVSRFRVRHGRAVSIGMAVEAGLARDACAMPAAHVERLTALLARLGLPTAVPRRLDVAALVAATRHDKKVRGRDVHYALPARLGRMPSGERLTTVIEPARLRRALESTR